jgi:hypothetical protein
MGGVAHIQRLVDLIEQALHHRGEQPGLATEMVMQGTTGQVGFGAQVVHDHGTEAFLGELATGDGDQPFGGVRAHGGAAAAGVGMAGSN